MLNQDVIEFIGNDIDNPLGYSSMNPLRLRAGVIFLSVVTLIQLIGLLSFALYAHK